MKKKLFSLLAVGLMCQAVQAQEHDFSIQLKPGKDVPKSAKMFVRYFVDKKLVLDSVVLDGKAKVYQGKIDQATPVNLYYSPEGAAFFGRKANAKRLEKLDLYVDKGKTTVAFNNDIKNAIVKGAPIQKEFAIYENHMRAVNQQMDDLAAKRSTLYSQSPVDKAAMEALNEEISKLDQQKRKAKETFIRNNPNSYFSLLALTELAGYDIDTEYVEPMLLGLSPVLQERPEGKQLAEDIAVTKRVGIGKLAPNFTQPDTEGKPVSLSDFKGQYVLVDFWASWCGPCRADNPNLVKAYQAFKDKNFTILGVSLDKEGKKQDWLNAIEKDGLPWYQVSDLLGWKSQVAALYGIKAIPQNFLIDPQGKIIAKNLHGQQLIKTLEKVL